MENKLSIPEILFLLSVNPEKGGLSNGFGYTFDLPLVAAYIMELHTKGIVGIEGRRVKVLKTDSNDPIERFILSKFEGFDRDLTIGRWINRVHFFFRHIKKELKSGMEDKRLIRLEDRQFLFIRWKKPFLADKMKTSSLRGEVGDLVRSGGTTLRGRYILSLLEPAGLMRRLFPEREQRRNARRRIRQSGVENEVSVALKRAIAARRAAAT